MTALFFKASSLRLQLDIQNCVRIVTKQLCVVVEYCSGKNENETHSCFANPVKIGVSV